MIKIRMNIENLGRFKKTYPNIPVSKIGDAEYMVEATDRKLLEPFGELIIDHGSLGKIKTQDGVTPESNLGIVPEAPLPPIDSPPLDVAPAPNFNDILKSFCESTFKTQIASFEKVLAQAKQTLASKILEIETAFQSKLAKLEQNFEQRISTTIAEKVGSLNERVDQVIKTQASEREALQGKISSLSDELLSDVANDVSKCQENCCNLKEQIALETARYSDEHKKIVEVQIEHSGKLNALQDDSRSNKEYLASLVASLRNIPLLK